MKRALFLVLLAAAGCAKELDQLGTFECPADGICPGGFNCTKVGCVPEAQAGGICRDQGGCPAGAICTTLGCARGPDPAHSSLSAAEPSHVVGNDAGIALTAVLRTADGTPFPNLRVKFSAGATESFSPSDEPTTDAEGKATVWMSSTRAGGVTATAQAGQVSLSTGVTFVAGPPTAATSSLTATPAAVTVGGSTQLWAEFKDAFGNPATCSGVVLANDPVGNDWFGKIPGSPVGGGSWYCPLASGPHTLWASCDGAAVSCVVTCTAGPPTQLDFHVFAGLDGGYSGPTAQAGMPLALEAVVLDQSLNRSPGTVVFFSTDEPGARLEPATGTTDDAGVLVTRFTSTKAGPWTVWASVPVSGLQEPVNVGVFGGPPAPGSTVISLQPRGAYALEGCSVLVPVSAQDQFGNLASSGQIHCWSPEDPGYSAASDFLDGGAYCWKVGDAGVQHIGVYVEAGADAGFDAGMVAIGWLHPAAVTATTVGVSSSTGIAAADLNRDGLVDAVVPESGWNRVDFIYGTPAGPSDYVWRQFGAAPSGAAAADLDRDGWPDLALADGYSYSRPTVLLNQHDGGFLPSTLMDGPPQTESVALADLRDSGYPDILLVGHSSDSLYVLRNEDGGTFTSAPQIPLPAYMFAQKVLTADLNGDQRPDALVASASSLFMPQVQVLINQDGTLVPQAGYSVAGTYLTAFGVADFGGDGWSDFLVGDQQAGLRIWHNERDGGFTQGPPLGLLAAENSAILPADFNGDGILDFAFVGAGFNVSLGIGTPAGFFLLQSLGYVPGQVHLALGTQADGGLELEAAGWYSLTQFTLRP